MGKQNKIPKAMQRFESKPLFIEMCTDSFISHIPVCISSIHSITKKSKKLVVNQMKPESSDPAQET